jgi:hypothetical protein
MPANLGTSNYNNRLPVCVFSKDASDNVVLTVSNLRTTGTNPTNYGLYFTGLKTGPAARSAYKDGDSSTGAFATLYVGTKASQTINGNGFVFTSIEKSSGVTIVGNPDQNNVESELTINFNVD